MKNILPAIWKVPEQIKSRLGETVGRQRPMAADGHLVLVLHEPPGPDDDQRVGRFFWRDAEGAWKSNSLGTGVQALRTHVTEFAARIDALEEQVEHAACADDYFQVLQAVVPLHRTARNLHAALQQAREMVPADRDLIVLRDQANDLERAAELLHADAKNGLDFTVARETEKQSWRIYEMTVASHRLNLLVAMFFPIATLSTIFGMNLSHGLNEWNTPVTFYAVLGAGLVIGVFLMGLVVPPRAAGGAAKRADELALRTPHRQVGTSRDYRMPNSSTSSPAEQRFQDRHRRPIRWAMVLGAGLLVWLAPVPGGISDASWRLLAIFVSTIVALIVQPVPGGCAVLLAIAALALGGVMPIGEALGGYADPIVWLVLAAFFMSRGMIKTGLGRRIAYMFIRAIGHRSLGLAYALIGTDFLLASFIPSNGARTGGILFPITKSLTQAYQSEPGPTAARLGAFLMTLVYQCDVIICATFLTGQASNVLIASFGFQVAEFEINYAHWLLGAIVPSLVSLAVVPALLYRINPPEVKHTPEAAALAAEELRKMGPLTSAEKLMLLVFLLVATLWMTTAVHGIHYAAVALLGIATLLLTGVLDWEDVLAERAAWDVYIWYGGLVRMAAALGETGLTERFAETAAGYTAGWTWWAALAALLLVYFYAHYAFASITAHSTAMFSPFLVVMLAAGAPVAVAVLLLAYFSNLCALLTHYGTTPAPIYFGAGYVSQRTWWRLGLLTSIPIILIWALVGPLWWKLLGWW